MKTKWIWLFSLLLILGGQFVSAQMKTDKYWVIFTDKGDITRWKPSDFLAQRSIDRRERQGIPLHFTDYPIEKSYALGVSQAGAQVLHPSKWLNAVSVRMDDATAATVASLPFVQQVKRIPKVILDMDPVMPMDAKGGYSPGFTATQIQMLGLERLHQNGYNGRGVLISMMDNGFHNADQNPYLAHLFQGNRIVATWDFVHGNAEVFDEGDHGAMTLSILGAWSESNADPKNWFVGTGHGASFILCHTEDNAGENHQEEDNWARAMEYADSIGADLFSTSLGYRDFDNGDDYGYAGLDGNTTIITRAADLAASKGIVVMNAAGNNGNNKMLAPSDGDSVISVGAVNTSRVIANFSSRGPSYDQRIKPDISAMGEGTSYVSINGILSQGNGTSFSCPVAAGMVACLLQSAPNTGNMQLYDALIRSADRYATPDSLYGYGIPYAPEAYRLLTGDTLKGVPPMSKFVADSMVVYPVPATDNFAMAIDNDAAAWTGTMEMFDMGGRKVWSQPLEVAPFYNVFRFTRANDYAFLHSGRYVLRVRDAAGEVKYSSKITILTER